MPRREWRLRLQDILDSAEKIRRYTDGMDFEAFAQAEIVSDAVTRNLGIIGEASRHIPPALQQRYADVPWRLMQDMRNVIIHDYPGVDLEIVWRTIREDLPPTIARLREILDAERRTPTDTDA